jgi:foldase protein PrsA
VRNNRSINRLLTIGIITISVICLSCKKEKDEAKRENSILAKVNGEAITIEDFEKEKIFMFFTEIQPKTSPNETAIMNKNLLSKIIDKKILLQEARKNHITVSNEELEKEIARIKNDYPEETFAKFFKENAISYDDWKNKLSELMIMEKLLQTKTESNPPVSEEEIYLYYKAHIDEFKNINKILLRQILVQDAKTAEEVKKRLKAGENFEKLAEEFSTGYEKKNGGLLPLLSSEELPKELEDVFKLNINEIFGPVKTDYGYHIVRIEKKIIRKKVELKDAKNTIIEILKREKINESLKEYLTDLRKNTRIEVFPSEILQPEKT